MDSLGKQAGSFAAIGAIGFLVDAGILTALNGLLDIDLLRARLVSFSTAVTVTWLMNRHLTFAHRRSLGAAPEWARYALVNGIGALLNLSIFFWIIDLYPAFARWPVLPLAIAASVALIFNFLASRRVAFPLRKP
jgi:putative flippase GtrA